MITRTLLTFDCAVVDGEGGEGELEDPHIARERVLCNS